ncbi:carcinoembryonic antigen-related cell adhesion molecule 5-like [Hyla sarda]|uniref:carcinoembryonic antigen-related cell adhesion molecule 5-like n=1 Tax=Hyla sarda TaxID=327740 RepID=UPI0024C39391|nr:carcinoembryonic antigen-related cell adhesion molecule 5-like [Hyla sarda]
MDVTGGMGNIQPIPQHPVVNGSVTLSVTGITEEITNFIWYKGPDKAPKKEILSYFPGNSTMIPGPLNRSQVTPYMNGSLQIQNLQLTDGGKYTVTIQTVTLVEDINVMLGVYEPVTKTKITASTTQPHANDIFTLTCHTSHATTIKWTRRGTNISSETSLSADNKTLVFPNIKEEDSGEYQCEAQNLVSEDISDPYGLDVYFLSSMTMDATSGMISIQLIPQYPVINGSVTLSVTGITEDIVSFIWYKEPKPDPQYHILTYIPGSSNMAGPESSYNSRITAFNNGSLHVKDLQITDEGNYKVRIQTVKSAETMAVTLAVYEPVIWPKITASSPQPKENDPFNLTCATLHALMVTWTRRGTSINYEAELSGDNKTLTFSNIRREDSGEYQCEAQNLVSKASSDPYAITVAYGPHEAQIEGPLFVRPGSPITLTCSADSFPSPEYQWKVNDTDLNESNNKLNVNNTTTENQGLYMCVVRNPVTARNATASVYVNVTSELQTYEDLIIAAFKAGLSLVSVVVLGVASIIGGFFLCKKLRTRRRDEATENTQGENPVYENMWDKETAEQPKEESSYMDQVPESMRNYTEGPAECRQKMAVMTQVKKKMKGGRRVGKVPTVADGKRDELRCRTVLLGLTMDVTSGMGRIQLIPQYPIINGSVTMSVTGITGDIQVATWFKGPNPSSQYSILAYFPGSFSSLVSGPLYSPRFSAFNNGSLQIKDLLITDQGNYIARIQTGTQEDIAVTLTVYEPVTKPKITAPSNQPKEFERFALTCDTSQANTIRWSRRGGSISPITTLYGDNKTLLFFYLKREDAGEYQCEAQNLVSKDSSDPYKVTVAYGPDYVKIEGSSYVRPGSSITLSCSADSFPTPEYQWKHNNTVLEEKTNKYSISSAINENEGLYWCIVKNTVTARTASVSIYVNVTDGNPMGLILGLAFAIIFGALLIIIGSVWLYRKRVTKRMNESSENRREDIPVYENVKAAQPKEESLYTGLQFRHEDTYTELKK